MISSQYFFFLNPDIYVGISPHLLNVDAQLVFTPSFANNLFILLASVWKNNLSEWIRSELCFFWKFEKHLSCTFVQTQKK